MAKTGVSIRFVFIFNVCFVLLAHYVYYYHELSNSITYTFYLTIIIHFFISVDLPDELGVDHPGVLDMFPADAVKRAREIKAGLGGVGTCEI